MNHSSIHTTDLHGFLRRMRAGDAAARNELLQKLCGPLEKLAAKMLRRFPNVQRYVETGDVLNSALLRLLRSLEKLEPASMREFYGLAAEHIRRELLDLARRFYGVRGIGVNVVDHQPTDDSDAGFDAEDRREDEAELDRWFRLHQEVENLPTEEREVVSLIFYHGWTQGQIAEVFQVTERTVRRWWKSALLKLHDALGDGDSTRP